MSQLLYPVYPNSWPFVMEGRTVEAMTPGEADKYWAEGWRHFGSDLFRSSLMVEEMCIKRQVSLRLDVGTFTPSKSQRRTLRKNGDLEFEFGPARPGEDELALFGVHKERFERNVPHSLAEFLGDRPDGKPCACLQLSVRREGRLIAASFLALGGNSCSSVYAVFDPAESKRRLGIYTMLLEIEHARSLGMESYYSGYATVETSCYDYKKQFEGLSYFDWAGEWRPMEEMAL
ncbi:MAG: GNAT family N-acetyltransferase [Verrucomicrobia bacterium]|nr:GNAT family N-acetyltransferase [Verrucomicrobiota bacterium]MDA1006363.1 GNAT family N-acetyltransferase [Verrucomicrobiota bacterium]